MNDLRKEALDAADKFKTRANAARVKKTALAVVAARESAAAEKPLETHGIPMLRQHDYGRLYFNEGHAALSGIAFPLKATPFKMQENINAPEYWKDALSAFGLDSRNLSYPKE